MCVGFFLAAVMISILRDLLPEKYAAFVPIPMAAAIPFYIGAQLAVSHLRITLWTYLMSYGMDFVAISRADWAASSSLETCLLTKATFRFWQFHSAGVRIVMSGG